MLVLSIDTATKACAVGLCRDGKILAEYKINMGMTHSEGLMPQLEQLLERTGVQKADIDLIAVSMGPGSFTGLRIGLATAEALAYAWKKPLQGVATPLALAYNLPFWTRKRATITRRCMNGRTAKLLNCKACR